MPVVKKTGKALKTTLAVVFCMSAVAGAGAWSASRPVASADAVKKSFSYAASPSTIMAQAGSLPRVELSALGEISTDERTEMAIAYAPVGLGYRTNGAESPLPALSLIKLYIAQYVAEHGSPEDVSRAAKMVSLSDDKLAEKLYEKFPDSVNAIARKYGLQETYGGRTWGVSRTSATDVVYFVSQLREEQPDSVVLQGMRKWSKIAADGYRQDFGLARMPGIEGAKLGWSNSRGWHSSVVFGPGYVIAAVTFGGKKEHTMDVAKALANVEFSDLTPEPSASTKKPAAASKKSG